MPKVIEKKLIERFKARDSFDRDELYKFYLDYEPELKKSTFNWRIYDLNKKNIIRKISQSLYKISCKPTYTPNPSDYIIRIGKKIKEQFKDIDYCIWETRWINEFSQHQIFNKMIIVEVERDFVNSLYYHLNDHLNLDVFVEPDKKDLQLYISESEVPVVLQRLVTRAPKNKLIIKKTPVFVATLEKILVDLFVEERLFHFYQGSEIIYIYQNILDTYAINFTRMFSYAKRRNKEEEIKQFISKHSSITLENIVK